MTAETLESRVIQEKFERLAVLRHSFEQSGDETNTRKLAELVEKVQNDEFVVGFCGHFSAGKSTMINRIAGVDLLPSNPIPTSANLAKIQSGESAFAHVYFTNGEAVEFSFPYDLGEIRRFAVDGKVRSIEINHPLEDFPTGITLLDTPGIDSTDDAHRVATESALHLADMIFYVTDYNHVLSEMNVAFLKQLQQQNKRIILVVNQIDKHSSDELHFKDYRQGIIDGFASQGIMPEHIFFTSLRSPNHPQNEFAELKASIKSLVADKDQLIDENAEIAARQLIKEHIDWYLENQTERRENSTRSLDGLSEEARQNLLQTYREIEQKLTMESEKPEQFIESEKLKVSQLLDSAILMPYETREAGRSYVESIQPGFKVGLLGAKKKTEQERKTRLDDFYKKVTETASVLDWQIKELLVKEADQSGIADENFKQSVYDLQVEIDEALLTEQIQSGATFNADYVLRYSEKVADAIKQRYRRAAFEKLETARTILQQDSLTSVQELKASQAELNEKVTALNNLRELDDETEEEHDRLLAILNGTIEEEELASALAALPEKTIVTRATTSDPETKTQTIEPKTTTHSQLPQKTISDTEDFHLRLKETAERLRQTSDKIQSIKGLQTSAHELRERSERLENNRFTVTLFGAFSAGKSSFANALIGESALPVSPNPTTAAINKISPPDDQHPHKTAVIHFKKQDEVAADVRGALKRTGKALDDLDELSALLETLEPTPFLQAVANGYDHVKDQLGTQQTVDVTEFNNIVANETKAVFVESIELYYDCQLTRQGITLVDTPGADSINARHTDVAFDYIKNADAILFVTYYNHAFSRADREFLMQLGRVKDSFAMDKMYFIVNASDLAASADELDAVVDYVADNLTAYGIRNPRVYPVSSQTALAAKQGKTETAAAFNEFEKAFKHFTMEELTDIAVKAAEEGAARVTRTLDSFLTAAREDETVRQRKHDEALQTKQKIKTVVYGMSEGTEKQALAQEIDQLLHYVEQRVSLRYLDLFKETFNPSVLNGSGSKKETLQKCFQELLQLIGFDLAQEMRATALRSEKYSAGLLKERFEKVAGNVQSKAKDYTFPPYENPVFDTPIFENGLEDLEPSNFNDILGLFKNAKQFFEKDGKSKMSERLQERLRQPISAYLEANGNHLKERYDEAFHQEMEKMKEHMLEQIEEYSEGILSALAMEADADRLEETKNAIQFLWK